MVLLPKLSAVASCGQIERFGGNTVEIPLTQKSLTQFPLPWFLACVRANGEISH